MQFALAMSLPAIARGLLAPGTRGCKRALVRSLTDGLATQNLAWQVSSYGRVKSLMGSVSFGSPLQSGYRRVAIQGTFYYVHRLVAAAFLLPPDKHQWQVNHVDGDPSNNHYSNLQYCTPSENMKHSWQTNLTRQSNKKPVYWRVVGQASWFACESRKDAANKLRVSQQSIFQSCRGTTKQLVGPEGQYEVLPAEHAPEPRFQPGEIWQDARHPDTGAVLSDAMVSTHGRIWRWQQNHMTYGSRHKNGYLRVNYDNRTLSVHRLVAATFLGEDRSRRLDVNHLDCNRSNNRLENLEFATRSENMKHSYLQRQGQGRGAVRGKPVQARKQGCEGPWLSFISVGAAASHAKVCRDSVSSVCNGRKQHCKGWCFRYAEEESWPGEEWRVVDPAVMERARANVKSLQQPFGASRWCRMLFPFRPCQACLGLDFGRPLHLQQSLQG